MEKPPLPKFGAAPKTALLPLCPHPIPAVPICSPSPLQPCCTHMSPLLSRLFLLEPHPLALWPFLLVPPGWESITHAGGETTQAI